MRVTESLCTLLFGKPSFNVGASRSSPYLDYKGAVKIANWYKERRPDKADFATAEIIMNESSKSYWLTLEKTEILVRSQKAADQEIPYIFARQMFMDHRGLSQPQETLHWMSISLLYSNVDGHFPFLRKEYSRRFKPDLDLFDYDKVLHFVWGSFLTSLYGSAVSLSIGAVKEIIDTIKVKSNPAECWNDFVAHYHGDLLSKELNNKNLRKKLIDV